jgi:anti-sigma B factor antagonist
VIPDQPSDPRTAAVSVHDDGTTMIVSASGAIDALTAPALRDAIASVLDDDPRALVIDLTRVDFLGSVGLEILVTTRQAVAETTPVIVVADGPITRRPIELTGVDEFLTLFPTLATALDSLRT